jgi:hypothetical protein
MATIVTRAGKGAPLTNAELDANFTNINDDKLETAGGVVTGNLGVGGDTTGVVDGITVTSKFCVKSSGPFPVGGFVFANNTSAGTGSGVFYCRSRGTLASPSIVQNNDRLATLFFAGHDGVDLALAAQIEIEVDGVPGSNDMPTRMIFKTTPAGQQTPVEAIRIGANQVVTLANALPIASGGTGQTTAGAAINALLPAQTSQSGKYLTTDGTNPSWANVPSPNNGTLTMNVSGTGLSGSATFTADQAGASTFTVTSNATSANTNSTIVARDASGNFSAGTITATLSGNATTSSSTTGNAATATALQNARTIGGVSFDGTANINLPGVNTAGNQNTTGTAANVTGTVAIANGGTGATTQQAAINALAGAATSAQYLRGNGTNVLMSAIQAADVPTLNQNTTGNAATATTATNANNIAIAADTTSTGSFFVPYVSATTGNVAVRGTRLTVQPSTGNFTAVGTVTANSDERIKTDWAGLPADFIERLAGVKSGTYTRLDTGARQAGSSAQDWQNLLPEVVTVGEDEQGTLSLGYGNAALVAAVELAKVVVELKAEVQSLKAQLKG